MEFPSEWLLLIFVLLYIFTDVFISRNKKLRQAIYTKSLPENSYDEVVEIISKMKNISKKEYKHGKYIYFEIDDMKHLINWSSKYPVLKSLNPIKANGTLLLMVLVSLPTYGALNSSGIMIIAYVLLSLYIIYGFFNDLKSIKYFFSKSYKAKLKVQHDQMAEILSKTTI